jgi:hypothetical protein
MRVTINGSGAILTHGDSLSGGGVIEFPINEPPEFVHTLSAYTVTGSAPSRKLKYQGHEIAVETPTSTAERAPSTGGGSVSVEGITGDTVNPATAIRAAAVTNDAGTAVLLPVIFAATDPGAVGAGQLWLFVDTNVADHANQYQLFIRSAANNSWLPIGVGDTEGAIVVTAMGGNAEAWYARSVLTVRGRTGSGGGQHGRAGFDVYDAAGSIAGILLIRDDGLVSLGSISGTTEISAGAVPIMLDATAGTASIGLGQPGSIIVDLTNGLVTMPGLPTADPVSADALWNDAGTLKVSAG